MNGEVIFTWTAIAGLYLFIKSIQNLFWWNEKRKDRAKREAFRVYVHTGTQTKAFYSLSSRAIKAAERNRFRHLAIESQRNSTFTSLTRCPRCFSFDVHYLKQITFLSRPRTCQRECKHCAFTWKQR